MKTIKLTQGQFALVDDADYDWLNQYKWCAFKCRESFYAIRRSIRTNEKGKHYSVYMHRQILGLGYGDSRQGDHIDHNTLDNRRDNLRICTCQQNHFNRKPDSNSTSRFKGVCWDKQYQKWQVDINIKGKHKKLGRFTDEKEAALAYDKAAIQEFGDFALLNFNQNNA